MSFFDIFSNDTLLISSIILTIETNGDWNFPPNQTNKYANINIVSIVLIYEMKISHHILQDQKKLVVSFKNVDIICDISQNNKKTAHIIANTKKIHRFDFIIGIKYYFSFNIDIAVFFSTFSALWLKKS